MKITPKSATSKSVQWVEFLPVLVLLAIVCIVSWPGMKAPRMLDDLDQLSFVANFNSWKDCFKPDSFNLFRPIKNLIFYCLADVGLFQWHATNLTFFLGAVLAVYVLMRRLLGSVVWAFLAAALWATCPTQATTAVWMSCVNISLSVILSCACILAHDRSRETSGTNAGSSLLAGLFLILAQVSYETAVSVPALCVMVDALRKRELFSRGAIMRYGILGAITLGFLVLRSQMGAVNSVQSQNFGFSPDIQAWQISVSAPWFLWKHFTMWLMPHGRVEFASTYLWGISASPLVLAASWAWLILVVAIIILSWKRFPWISFGLLWFLATSFPSSNLIPIWSGPIEDYYLIFPGIGLAVALLGIGRAIAGWIRSERTAGKEARILIGGGALLVIAFSRIFCLPLFWFQTVLWRDPLELYVEIEKTRPAQFQVQALIARELYLRGRLPEAEEWALKSYARGPWYPGNSMILGSVALDTGRLEDARVHLLRVIGMTKEMGMIHDYSRLKLAMTYISRPTERYQTREILISLLNNPGSPYHLDAINLQIESYLKDSKHEDALRAARKAARLHPDNQQLLALLKSIEDISNPLPQLAPNE